VLNFLQNSSDDQTAILGCVAALAAAGLVMYLSYFVGPARQIELAARRRAQVASPQLPRAKDKAA